MTFLIFLASLATLEYLLRPKPDDITEGTNQQRRAGRGPRVEDVSREGAAIGDLHALGTTLDALGRGQKPECDAEPSKTRAAPL